MTQQIQAVMLATEEATAALSSAYAAQVFRWPLDLTERLMIHMDSKGAFSPIVRRGRFIDGLIRTMAPELIAGTRDLLVQAAYLSVGELGALPGAGDIMRPSILALETAVDAQYKTLIYDTAHIMTGLRDTLKVEVEALFASPKSLELSAKIIAEKAGIRTHQARTIVNTAMASVQRDVQQVALNAMPDKEPMALYMGPNDDRTRSFCKALVGRVIKRKYFADLDNNQKGASSFKTNGGGWNCRHRLMPVSAAYARRHKLIPINIRTVGKANSAAKAKR